MTARQIAGSVIILLICFAPMALLIRAAYLDGALRYVVIGVLGTAGFIIVLSFGLWLRFG